MLGLQCPCCNKPSCCGSFTTGGFGGAPLEYVDTLSRKAPSVVYATVNRIAPFAGTCNDEFPVVIPMWNAGKYQGGSPPVVIDGTSKNIWSWFAVGRDVTPSEALFFTGDANGHFYLLPQYGPLFCEIAASNFPFVKKLELICSFENDLDRAIGFSSNLFTGRFINSDAEPPTFFGTFIDIGAWIMRGTLSFGGGTFGLNVQSAFTKQLLSCDPFHLLFEFTETIMSRDAGGGGAGFGSWTNGADGELQGWRIEVTE